MSDEYKPCHICGRVVQAADIDCCVRCDEWCCAQCSDEQSDEDGDFVGCVCDDCFMKEPVE